MEKIIEEFVKIAIAVKCNRGAYVPKSILHPVYENVKESFVDFKF
jgi:hypothetical protein